MFLWWRSWHLRNDIVFSKGDASVSASAQFLFSYADALTLPQDRIPAPDLKGKTPLFMSNAAPIIPAVTKSFQIGSRLI